MNFCINIDIDTLEREPHLRDAVGELLREEFFEQKLGLGCRDVFEVKEDVIQYDSHKVEFDNSLTWSVFSKKFYYVEPYKYRARGGIKEEINVTEVSVIMKYYKDIRNVLVFVFEDGSALLAEDAADMDGWLIVNYENWIAEQ